LAPLAPDLLHLPDKPAGVAEATLFVLAVDLLHLPGKPAGVAEYSDPFIRNQVESGILDFGFSIWHATEHVPIATDQSTHLAPRDESSRGA
jgi:hypothetical protein